MRRDALFLRPGEWGEHSWKIPVLGAGPSWVVLDQPSAVGAETPDPDEATRHLQAAFRKGIAEGRPSTCALLSGGATSIYPLNCGGPVVFAGDRDQLAAMREDYGSARWELRFLLLARSAPAEQEILCDLPVAVHKREPRSLVSHTTGKRASTRFRRLAQGPGGLQLWEALTRFLRPDQIRLHASEVGIAIAGEDRYGQHEPLSRADLPGTRRPGGKGFVLFNGPAVHLAELNAGLPGGEAQTYSSTLPKALAKWMEALS